MLHHKLIAWEQPGIYLVVALISEEDQLTITNQFARKKLAKGITITHKLLLQ
jgi:DNA repair protein RadC